MRAPYFSGPLKSTKVKLGSHSILAKFSYFRSQLYSNKIFPLLVRKVTPWGLWALLVTQASDGQQLRSRYQGLRELQGRTRTHSVEPASGMRSCSRTGKETKSHWLLTQELPALSQVFPSLPHSFIFLIPNQSPFGFSESHSIPPRWYLSDYAVFFLAEPKTNCLLSSSGHRINRPIKKGGTVTTPENLQTMSPLSLAEGEKM